jgi:hypothetical protein
VIWSFEVDVGDEIVLAADLAGEAVVRLERDRVARVDLEHRLELGPERPDDRVAGEPVVHAGAESVSSST